MNVDLEKDRKDRVNWLLQNKFEEKEARIEIVYHLLVLGEHEKAKLFCKGVLDGKFDKIPVRTSSLFENLGVTVFGDVHSN